MIGTYFKNSYVNSLITKAFVVLIGVFNSMLMTRYLGPAAKGEFAYWFNIVGIFILILNLGVYQTYPMFKRQSSDKTGLLHSYLLISIAQFIIYFCICGLIYFITGSIFYFMIAGITCLMILSRQLVFISLVENIRKKNFIEKTEMVIFLFLLIFLYLFCPRQNMNFVFIALFVRYSSQVIMIFYKFRFRIAIKQWYSTLILLPRILKFGFFPMLTSLMIILNYKLDVIMLKQFDISLKNIGYYAAGVGLVEMVWIIPDAFKEVLFTKTAKKDSIPDIVFSLKINFYISLLIFIIILLFGDIIIEFLYGVAFLPSYDVIKLIIVGVIPMTFYKLINTLYVAKGKMKLSFMILTLAGIINIVVNLIFIPIYGINGAAVASLISYFFCGMAFYCFFVKDNKLSGLEAFYIKKAEILFLKEKFFK